MNIQQEFLAVHPVLAKAKMKKKEQLQTDKRDEEMEVGNVLCNQSCDVVVVV